MRSPELLFFLSVVRFSVKLIRVVLLLKHLHYTSRYVIVTYEVIIRIFKMGNFSHHLGHYHGKIQTASNSIRCGLKGEKKQTTGHLKLG